jgi:hypothetical protein
MATTSIVDTLKSQGKDSSYAARKKLAESMGITNYTGTAAQNTALIKAVTTTTPATTKTTTSATTIAPVKTATITPTTTSTAKTSTAAEIAAQKAKTDALIAGVNASKGIKSNTGSTSAWKATDYADNYQAEIDRLKAINPNDPRIAELNSLRSQKIASDPEKYGQYAVGDALNSLNQIQNFEETYQPSQTEDEYMSEITEKINALLEQQKITAAANAEKAKQGILTDADIAKQETDDAYAQQLAELASEADKIRSAYSSGKRNVTTDYTNTAEELTAQTDKIIQLYEQNKSQLGIDKQDLIDELAASADRIRSTYASGKKNMETQNTEAMENLAAQTENILRLFEQSKNQLTSDKQALLDDLAYTADNIRNAYTSARRNIEAERAETLPTYDKAMNQQDVLAQREKKATEADFAQRGLQAGGQVTSELGEISQENLSQIGEITGKKQAYERDVSNSLTGLEETQATGLADVERQKASAEQEYTNKLNEIESNKTYSVAEVERLKAQATREYQNALADLEQEQASGLSDVERQHTQIERDYTNKLNEIESNKALSVTEVERLKSQAARDYQNQLADLEQSQVSGLSDIARAESTAAQTLSSSKMSIIKKVNAALSNLNTDEQALLDTLAAQRTEMMMDASQEYKTMTQAEKDAAFDRQLAQAGVAQESVTLIRNLLDDINNAKSAAVEAEIKQLEIQAYSDKMKLELKQMQQDLEAGKISMEDAKARLKIAQDQNDLEKQKYEDEKSQTEYDYKTDPDFMDDYAVASSGEGAYEEIKSMSAELIKKYGIDGYNALLKAAGG